MPRSRKVPCHVRTYAGAGGASSPTGGLGVGRGGTHPSESSSCRLSLGKGNTAPGGIHTPGLTSAGAPADWRRPRNSPAVSVVCPSIPKLTHQSLDYGLLVRGIGDVILLAEPSAVLEHVGSEA